MDFEYIGPKIRELSLYIRNNVNEQISKVEGAYHTNSFILHILRIAENKNEELYQKDLEQKLKSSKSTMCEMLNCLEKHDLIKRVPSKKDCRKNIIALTDKGRKVDDDVSEVIMNFEKKLSSKITNEEKLMLFAIIDKLKKED